MSPITHFLVGWTTLERAQSTDRDRALVAVHLHFVCDLLGSRGNRPEDLWGIAYLSPFSSAWAVEWSGQWPLVGWQNMLVTAVLIAWVLARALRTGYTPLRLASARADAALVAVLRKRFGQVGGKVS